MTTKEELIKIHYDTLVFAAGLTTKLIDFGYVEDIPDLAESVYGGVEKFKSKLDEYAEEYHQERLAVAKMIIDRIEEKEQE